MKGKNPHIPMVKFPITMTAFNVLEKHWTEGVLPLWLVATAGGMAVLFVVGLFFYGSYTGVGSA